MRISRDKLNKLAHTVADTLADIELEIMYDTQAIIHALPFHEGEYMERTGFMLEIRTDGLDL